MRAALIVNRNESDPGHVGDGLRSRAFDLVPHFREDHHDWRGLDEVDLVVALGSGWSTYWPDVADPVRAEQALMGDALGRGIPVLGICFGAQQLATVLGGSVTKAQSPEIGWFSVSRTPETPDSTPSAVFDGPWMQWHYDRFTIPTGAIPVAESSVGPQAFTAGRSLGLQFHPEATESIVAGWASGSGARELVDAGIDRADLLSRTRVETVGAGRRCDRILEWFLCDVAQGHIPKH